MNKLVRSAGIAGIVALLALISILPAAAQTPPTGMIDVADQAVAGDTITVAKATISQDGWIIVHKAGPDGKLLLTPPVGMVQIKAGDNSDVKITLTEAVADGAPLWPMLHIDEGVKGTYEFPNGPDTPVVANGAPVMKQIKVGAATAAAQPATPTGMIEVADQAVAGGTITVAKATISQDGWIIVHKAGPDGKLLLTPPVGMVQIKAGDNSDVKITLTEAVADGAPLWPMLHIDEGVKGTYEFPNGPDTPVVANGAPVMKQIKVGAAAAAPAAAPSSLPNTGGSDSSAALVLAALGLLSVGGLSLAATRRRAS